MNYNLFDAHFYKLSVLRAAVIVW